MLTQTVVQMEQAGTPAPEATAEYGWMVGGTDEQSLDTWAEGAARVGGLPEEMDSTRAELMRAYAVPHKVREWKGTVRIWVDNDNVVRGLERRLGVERADAVWARSENWSGSALEEGDSWRVQLGEGSELMVTSGKQLTSCWRGCRARWRSTGSKGMPTSGQQGG